MLRAIEALPKELGYLRRYDHAHCGLAKDCSAPDRNEVLHALTDGIATERKVCLAKVDGKAERPVLRNDKHISGRERGSKDVMA